jgi:hypothetical protein
MVGSPGKIDGPNRSTFLTLRHPRVARGPGLAAVFRYLSQRWIFYTA